MPLTYIHEPQRGISYARNACLKNTPANTAFLAMIDDDEIPAPEWLEQLLLVQAETNADVVYGPTLPVFHANVPAWIVKCGYFKKPRHPGTLVDRQPVTSAATCNVLLRASMLCHLNIQFDAALALSGGEDKRFFQQLRDAGYRFVWAAHAQVWETIPPSRACWSYMWRAAFRSGNLRLFLRLRRQPPRSLGERASIVIPTCVEALKAISAGILSLGSFLLPGLATKERAVLRVFQIAFGLGMLFSLFGFKYEQYK
jgi:hypothetical protein